MAALRSAVALLLYCPVLLHCSQAARTDDGVPDPSTDSGSDGCAAPYLRQGISIESAQRRFEMELGLLQPSTPNLGDNRWDLRLATLEGDLVPDATLQFSLWMPEHAHGSLKTVTVEEQSPGTYRAEPLSFHMPGVWEITVTIKTATVTDLALLTTCVAP